MNLHELELSCMVSEWDWTHNLEKKSIDEHFHRDVSYACYDFCVSGVPSRCSNFAKACKLNLSLAEQSQLLSP